MEIHERCECNESRWMTLRVPSRTCVIEVEGAGLVQPEEEKAARGPYKCLQISEGWVVRRMGPSSFQWCPVTG